MEAPDPTQPTNPPPEEEKAEEIPEEAGEVEVVTVPEPEPVKLAPKVVKAPKVKKSEKVEV